MVDAGALLQAIEAFGRPFAGQEFTVALIHLGRDQPRAFGIRTGADDRRHARHVGRQPRRIQIADMRLGGDQHLAAQMAALLFRGELILEMHTRRARRDIGLHDLEAVEGATEPGLGIGDDRREPVARRATLGMFDLVGASERRVDPPRKLRPGIGGVERLVGIHLPRRVGVGRDLPARQIDRLQPGAHHLHRLIARQCTQCMDIILALQQLPQLQRAATSQRVFDGDRTTQTLDIGRAVRALDPVKPPGRGGNQIGEALRHFLVLYKIAVLADENGVDRCARTGKERKCRVVGSLIAVTQKS